MITWKTFLIRKIQDDQKIKISVKTIIVSPPPIKTKKVFLIFYSVKLMWILKIRIPT